jgi:hypothetical protein
MLPKQTLILHRIETKQLPTRPVIAKYAYKPPAEAILITLILWLLKLIAPQARMIRNTWGPIRVNVTAAYMLASVFFTVIIESLASGYIQNMIGV